MILDSNREVHPDMKRIITEYGNSLLRMCFLYLKDIRLAEDAVQDTLIKVYKSYSQFKGNASEKTWIMSIAINVCKNYQRSSWWRRIDGSANLENIPSEQHEIEDTELIVQIMKLSPKYKEVILLYYYQDLKIKEIAEILKAPESTVAVRLKRARGILKTKLKGWNDYE
ncbi:sigma-70 family RNA polymerase sigma factor [Paenibacillus agri]|uniref:Sigma-70 family RNA polymerase sigma factor n=1 Tax=Paenibacillus agri TaxID=2744309 RepID=A0A850ES56_9BACL|nr:sigma-70 family RNA polymerase sigma factor [Paenibacillus agri]NUU62094.1 sigma-70 family RNA polymerase sigma factor [Paenibacillus agri]